jgi:adenylate kinase family enzyme
MASPQLPVKRNVLAGLRSADPRLGENHVALLLRARRVLVLGSSGAGKTHLSRRLAQILGLEAIHLDDHFWQPDGRPSSDAEWRKISLELAAGDSWIMDGTYERSLDLRMSRAEAIVLLEYSSALCLERLLRREMQNPSPQWTVRASRSRDRVDKDHVNYVSRYARATRPAVLASIERHGRGNSVVRLDSPAAAESLVAQLQQVA